MINKTHISSLLLSIAFSLNLAPMTALAGSAPSSTCGNSCSHEAAVGDFHYDTVSEAVLAASSGDTLSLLKDAALTAMESTADESTAGIYFKNPGTYTIYGNGHTLTFDSPPSDPTRNSSRPILHVGNGVTVNLGSEDKPDESLLILDGTTASKNRTNALVNIIGGTVNMYGGVTICNNATIGGTAGAGVTVYGGGTFNMHGGRIKDNTCNYMSSAIFATDGSTLNITGGEISSNTLDAFLGYAFGAIAVYGAKVANIKNCVISDNRSSTSFYSYSGGVMIHAQQPSTIENCTITNNHSEQFAGAVCCLSPVTIRSSVITDNSADTAGGAVFAQAECTIQDSLITNNRSGVVGGGIYAAGSAALNVDDNSAIYLNSAGIAADDVALEGLSRVRLPAVTAMQKKVSDYQMLGWFDDSENNRYDASAHAVEETTLSYTSPTEKYLKVPASKMYSVSVETDGNGRVSTDALSAVPGTTVTLTASPNSGYLFEKWQVVSGNAVINNDSFIMPSENVVIKAVFTKIPPVDLPQTGDDSRLGLYLFLLSLGCAGIAMLAIPASKSKHRG